MVEIIMDFTRSQRGHLPLYLQSFESMLPWLCIYDHTNYARWGPVYLLDTKLLEKKAPKVYEEFMNGKFVLKRSQKYFNQVPPDQATEWTMQHGISGITKNDHARDKFCITW